MKKLSTVSLFTVMICMLTPSIAKATNGLFLIGNGIKSNGMGGVGIAVPMDSLSAVTNPATISGMKNRFDIGVEFFKPNVTSQLGSVSADSVASVNGMGIDSLFIFPSMAVTYKWSEKVNLGVAAVPVGGGATKFKTNFYEAAAAGDANAPTVNTQLGVDYSVGEIVSTISYKMNESHSFGASLLIGIARFEAYGIGLFDPFTQSQGTLANFSDQGKDWSLGIGMRVGWLGDFGKFKVGAVYTSKVDMNEFDRYSELFAEHGNMDIPASAGIGISYQATPDLLVAFDVSQTFYEDARAVANLGPNLAGDPAGPLGDESKRLGLPDGLGFGWTNQTVYKIGTEYIVNEKWIARAGWNYGESPINENREIIMNLLAPGTVEHHLTLGGTYNISSDMAVNFSYVHAFSNKQCGPTYISDDGSNLGCLEMDQDSIGASFSMQY
jgi:long-chain fatty acid transport protein